MAKTKEHYIDKKPIKVIDNIFLSHERIKILSFIENSQFNIIRQPSGYSFLKTEQPTLKSDYTIDETVESGIFDNKFLVKYINHNNFRVQKTYVNLCTASDIYLYHTDTATVGSMTVIYYANLEWKPHWEGETQFSSDMIDSDYCASFIPGRMVIFDGTIPHKSTQPSYSAEQYRYVYVIKLVCDKDPEWDSSHSIEEYL
jgi:hypothetical protein